MTPSSLGYLYHMQMAHLQGKEEGSPSTTPSVLVQPLFLYVYRVDSLLLSRVHSAREARDTVPLERRCTSQVSPTWATAIPHPRHLPRHCPHRPRPHPPRGHPV